MNKQKMETRRYIFDHLKPKEWMLLLCDMQEGYESTVINFDQVISNSNKMLKVAQRYNIDIAITELKGKGRTVPELGLEYPKYRGNTDKKNGVLSMCSPRLKEHMKKVGVKSVILCGLEAHAAIKETGTELLKMRIKVYVIADACSSHQNQDRKMALAYLNRVGCQLTDTEKVLSWLGLESSLGAAPWCKDPSREPSYDSWQPERESSIKKTKSVFNKEKHGKEKTSSKNDSWRHIWPEFCEQNLISCVEEENSDQPPSYDFVWKNSPQTSQGHFCRIKNLSPRIQKMERTVEGQCTIV